MLFLVQLVQESRSAGRRIGVEVTPVADGVELSAVTADGPAARAGLRAGDRLLAIDGRPLHHLDDYDIAAQSFVPGVPATYRVARGGEVLVLSVLPGMPPDWGAHGVELLLILAFVVLGLLAASRQPADLRSRLLAFFSLLVALELALPQQVIGDPALNIALTIAFFLITGCQFAVELHLVSLIPEPQAWVRRHRWVVPLYYAVGLGIGVAVTALYLYEEVARSGWLLGAEQPAVDLVLAFVFPLWVGLLLVLVGRPAFFHPERRGRLQAGLVLLGVLPWGVYILGSTALDVFGQPYPTWLPPLEQASLLIYVAAVYVAVLRYDLFQIEAVVRRVLIYTVLTSALMLVFYLALGAGGLLLSRLVGDGRPSVWTVAGGIVALGLLFTPLRQRVERLIDRRLFPEDQGLRRRLTTLMGELPGCGQPVDMGWHLVAQLRAICGVRSAFLLLVDPGTGLLVSSASSQAGKVPPTAVTLTPVGPSFTALQQGVPLPVKAVAAASPALGRRLESLGAALLVPLCRHGALIGLLVLGHKENGLAYTVEERELLELVAHHVATLFENVELQDSATYEGLTGLLRREAVLEVLEKEVARVRRYGRPLTIGLADLDHFKDINDRYGHLAGDAVLKQVAEVLGADLRGSDAVGRYGGEEFLLVLPETDLAGAEVVAEKIRHRVESLWIPMDDGVGAEVRVSIGLATLESTSAAPAEEARALIAAADRALYRAKETGRNRVVVFAHSDVMAVSA